MALTDAPDQSQSDWLDYRVETIPGFLDRRDASGLTFTYVGENQTIVDWIG